MTGRPFQLFPRGRRHGFTLLELCIVLFIMALLAGATMPAMESAFTEQSLRGDAHQLSLMVKTAMIKSGEQQRPYLIRLDGKELLLEPAPSAVATDDASSAGATSAASSTLQDEGPAPEDVTMAQTLGNKLEFPDAQKANTWESLSSVRWSFPPEGLCPLPRVRLQHGSAYIEMSFNALTGDVEDEASYLP